MNGDAQPGGVDGIIIYDRGLRSSLTVEPMGNCIALSFLVATDANVAVDVVDTQRRIDVERPGDQVGTDTEVSHCL